MDMTTRGNREGGSLQSNASISNQTYQNFMTTTGFSDNEGTNDQMEDFFNTLTGNFSKAANNSDKGTMVHNDSKSTHENSDNQQQQTLISRGISAETFADPTTTSSIYELFDLGRGNKKKFESNKILSRTDRSVHLNSSNSKNNSVSGAKRVKNNKTKLSTLDRNERSANLSHITGSARKIQLYIKNRFLQLLPDGTVNGTTDDLSDYSK